MLNDIPKRKLQTTYNADIIMEIYVNVTVPSSSFSSYLTQPWNLIEVTPTPTDTPTTNTISLRTVGLIVVGCTVGVLAIAAISVGIHAVSKRNSDNARLVSSANPLNKTKQANVAAILPSRKFLDFKDDTDNRVSFPPVN